MSHGVNRFEALRGDPAYQAAVDGVPPDKFLQKYVISAPARDVQTMTSNLAGQPVARQSIGAGTVDWLANQANVAEGRGNFTQAGFNKGLRTLQDKLPTVLDPQTAQSLKDVGDAAYLAQRRAPSSVANTSNSTSSAMAEAAKMGTNAAITGAAHIVGGAPGAALARYGTNSAWNWMANRASEKALDRTLNYGNYLPSSNP